MARCTVPTSTASEYNNKHCWKAVISLCVATCLLDRSWFSSMHVRRWDSRYLDHQHPKTRRIPNSTPSRHLSPLSVREGCQGHGYTYQLQAPVLHIISSQFPPLEFHPSVNIASPPVFVVHSIQLYLLDVIDWYALVHIPFVFFALAGVLRSVWNGIPCHVIPGRRSFLFDGTQG